MREPTGRALEWGINGILIVAVLATVSIGAIPIANLPLFGIAWLIVRRIRYTVSGKAAQAPASLQRFFLP